MDYKLGGTMEFDIKSTKKNKIKIEKPKNFKVLMYNDDFTTRETEYKGKKETHAYFDNTKSDNNITMFSTEEINGKEYIAMRDLEGNVHYFDKSNNLKEIEIK